MVVLQYTVTACVAAVGTALAGLAGLARAATELR
jgi:hypothetical protein